MSRYPILNLESAPEHSRPALAELQQSLGLIPNVAAVMAGSPVLLNGFLPLFRAVHASSFCEAQLQVLLLTNAVTNESSWPVAFHSALALQQGVSPDDVRALREGSDPHDRELAALGTLTRSLIQKRGRIDDGELEVFLAAGFRPLQVLEVIAVLAASTMTNYSAHVGQPPLEPQFLPHAWPR
jgi:alkylhydroperoxidase family enzyme